MLYHLSESELELVAGGFRPGGDMPPDPFFLNNASSGGWPISDVQLLSAYPPSAGGGTVVNGIGAEVKYLDSLGYGVAAGDIMNGNAENPVWLADSYKGLKS